jgi:hypothetical protein
MTRKLLRDRQGGLFGHHPLVFTALVGAPPLLHVLQCSPWWYLPLALLLFSYLHAVRLREDRQLAMGIACDPQLAKMGKHMYPRHPLHIFLKTN